MFAVDVVVGVLGAEWRCGGASRGGFCGAVDELVGCVDDHCAACGWARCDSEVVQQIPVACTGDSCLTYSAVVDYVRGGNLGPAAAWHESVQVLAEVDVPCSSVRVCIGVIYSVVEVGAVPDYV